MTPVTSDWIFAQKRINKTKTIFVEWLSDEHLLFYTQSEPAKLLGLIRSAIHKQIFRIHAFH